MAPPTVAEQYVDLLARAGARRVHGVVGDSLDPVADAVRRHDGLEWAQVRHEETTAIATAAGAHGIRVEKATQVREALREAFAHGGPALVGMATDPDALAIPPKSATGQVTGSALSAGRTVLTGGVGRVIDLARANLRTIPRP
ncbi:thiamine pyrophosphate-binding protein [Streptomyces eurythermus]